jgi:hypothetical protein
VPVLIISCVKSGTQLLLFYCWHPYFYANTAHSVFSVLVKFAGTSKSVLALGLTIDNSCIILNYKYRIVLSFHACSDFQRPRSQREHILWLASAWTMWLVYQKTYWIIFYLNVSLSCIMTNHRTSSWSGLRPISCECKDNKTMAILLLNAMRENEILSLKYHQHVKHGRCDVPWLYFSLWMKIVHYSSRLYLFASMQS